MILCEHNYISYFLTSYGFCNLNMQYYRGNTFLHRAINQARDHEHVDFLLELGANPYIKDKNNENCIIHYPLTLASDNNITTETKLLYLEKFIHKISIKKYAIMIYDLFAATLNNSSQLQKEIWKKALELKSQIGSYRENCIKDFCFFTNCRS